MTSPTPREHVLPYMWEIGEGGRTCIVGHGQQWHVLIAVDTFRTQTEAVFRLNEIEANFEAGKPDQSPHLTDLLINIDHALPFIRAVAPAKVIGDLEAAIDKLRK
jgi:hypothetical protein